MFWVWQNSGHKLWIFRFRKMYTCKVNVKYTCAIWVCSIRAVQRRSTPLWTVIPRRTPVSCYLIARHGRFSTTRTIKPYMTEQRRTLVNFKNKNQSGGIWDYANLYLEHIFQRAEWGQSCCRRIQQGRANRTTHSGPPVHYSRFQEDKGTHEGVWCLLDSNNPWGICHHIWS